MYIFYIHIYPIPYPSPTPRLVHSFPRWSPDTPSTKHPVGAYSYEESPLLPAPSDLGGRQDRLGGRQDRLGGRQDRLGAASICLDGAKVVIPRNCMLR